MEYRRLGSTGLSVSVLALGTWTFGWSVDEPAAAQLLSAAVAAGCNFIDTADRYGRPVSPPGTAEAYIGRWLASQKREQVVLATKARGRLLPGPNGEGLSRHYLLRAVEASLQRLRTDYIDLYQVHWPDPATPLDETLRALETLVRQGKVRYIGCSNFPAWLLCRALWISDKQRWARFETTQVHYNLAHRAEYERELQHLCRDQGVGVLAYSPLAEGFLTGKYRREAAVQADTRAAERQEVTAYFTPRHFDLLDRLQQVAAVHGCSPAQAALAWVLARPGVTAAIIGARQLSQLQDSLQAPVYRLRDEEIRALDEASAWPDDRTPLAVPAATR